MPNANRLFDALGTAARERLRPHGDLVHLTKARVLYEPGDAPRYAFFPLDGMISLLASTDEGQALEVAMVGDDGFVGVPIVLNVRSSPYQVMVQVSCAAYRVSADAFAREFQRGEELHAIALTYVHGLMLHSFSRPPATGSTRSRRGSVAGCSSVAAACIRITSGAWPIGLRGFSQRFAALLGTDMSPTCRGKANSRSPNGLWRDLLATTQARRRYDPGKREWVDMEVAPW